MTSQIEVTPTRLYIRALVSGTADSAEVRIYQSDSLMGWHFGSWTLYSYRKARTGCTRDARLAGI
jgi:hypothetical protein